MERFEENDDFTVGKYVTFDYSWIGMNLRNPALQDVNVRQALRYAIDVPAIIEAAFEGRWDQATGLIPPSMDIGFTGRTRRCTSATSRGPRSSWRRQAWTLSI